MKVKSLIIGTTSLVLFPLTMKAQFYTIMREKEIKITNNTATKKKAVRGSHEEYFYAYQDSMKSVKASTKEDDYLIDFFSTTEGHEISIEKDIPVFVNVKDSLLFGLIKQRMDVCLPLDFISVTSKYGYRKDPFKKCSAFHDGIDLECNMKHVYSMLPGRVLKVVYSKKDMVITLSLIMDIYNASMGIYL